MKQSSIARRIALAMGAALWFAAAAGAQTVRVYKVQHRVAEELAPLVESAIHGEGRVVADTRSNALVLSGSPRAVSSALELLSALDVRAHMVRLRYQARSTGELASAGASVRWRVGAGGFRIGDVRWASGAAAIAVEGGASASMATLTGELRILEGQSGRIATGSSLPVTSRRIQRSGRGVAVEESTAYATAESGFEASPRVLHDGSVELALRPFDASVRADGAIDRTSAETRLVLAPGATVALGGIARNESAQSGALAGAGASGATSESLLLVTVDVE
jgi:type II secretory pathway component GspD/PulD (secretin)